MAVVAEISKKIKKSRFHTIDTLAELMKVMSVRELCLTQEAKRKRGTPMIRWSEWQI